MVQVLTDMNLSVRRAYISSDGEWFMDGMALFTLLNFSSTQHHGFGELCFQFFSSCLVCVVFALWPVFHVTDQNGKKFMQDDVADRIQQVDLRPFLF